MLVSIKPLRQRRTWTWLLPLLVALVIGVAFQGSRGLAETSETRYAECAREMLVTGNWLEPTLEFQPHWTKPPLTYWFIAMGLKVFGANAWGARMPAVLAFLVAVSAVTLAGRRLWGQKAGLFAGLALALGFPAFAVNMTTTDIFLLAAQSAAGSVFIHAATEPERERQRRQARWMWVLWGVCFLIKGPPALLPLLAMIPWNLMQPAARRVPLADPLGLVLGLSVGLSWYLLMVARNPGLLDYFVGTEIVDRVASDLGHNRAWYKAFEIYIPAMLAVAGVLGIWACVRACRGGWLQSVRWRGLWQSRDERTLLLGWILLPLLVFSISTSKLPLYVLPLSAPAALLTAAVLTHGTRLRTLRRVSIAMTVLLVTVKGVAAHWPNDRDMGVLGSGIRAELAELPRDTGVVLWNLPKNHGISFYLDVSREQHPERVALGGKELFESLNPEEFLNQLRGGRWPDGVLLVAAKRDTGASSPEAVLGSGWIISGHETEHWRLLHIHAGAVQTVHRVHGG